MGKIDETVLNALVGVINSAVQEYDGAKENEKNKYLVRMNFIKNFSQDVIFLNEHSNDPTFCSRYGDMIIRDMLEQLIEFLYIQKNPAYSEEYLGLKINFEALERKTSVVSKEELFGSKRYIAERPSVSDMAKRIGEKSSANGLLSLYKLYRILSERCHNSYFAAFIDSINESNMGVEIRGLNGSQISEIYIMIEFVMEAYLLKGTK